jgi:arylsulfatase A-like enzyme
VDDTIGKVMDRLARWRLAERTLVTIYSDHGEEFWDHLSQAHRFAHDPRPIHGIGHGHTHFQELLHVPWLATGPGVPAGVRRDEPVSLCDVAPTLLEWLGLDPLPGPQVSLPGLAGRSQAAAPREGASRHILAEDLAYGPDLVALRRGPWKLIAHRRGDPLALHHLVDDPGEQVDLIADEPAMTADLAQAVLAWRRAIADPAGAETPGGDWKDISGAVRKRLRDLGYTD